VLTLAYPDAQPSSPAHPDAQPLSSPVPAVVAPTAISSPPRAVHTTAAPADASSPPAHPDAQPSSPAHPDAQPSSSPPVDVLSSSPVLVAVTTTAAPSAMFVPAPDNEPLPLCVDTGVQAEGEYDPRSRVRRAILAGLEALPLRFVHPNGVEGVRDELLPQHAPDRVRTNKQQRMCDCTTCVRHATELMSSDQFAEVPPTPGIRLTPLPGLGLTHCPKGAATVLAKGLQESRKKTLIVCACSTCFAHRGLLWAYHHVQKVRRTPRSPLAGTPPKRRRVCNDPRH